MHPRFPALFLSVLFVPIGFAQVNWVKPLELPVQDLPSAIYSVASNDQGHFVIGASTVGGVNSLAVSSLDGSGATRWTYAPDELASFNSALPVASATLVAIDSDGSPVVTFACLNAMRRAAHCVVKLALADGSELWRTRIDVPDGPIYSGVAARLGVSSTGGYFLQSYAGLVVKLGTSGQIQWTHTMTPAYGARGGATANGDWVYLASSGVRRLAGADGSVRWSYDYPNAQLVIDADLLPQATDATLLHVRFSNNPLPNATDRLLKFDGNGQIQWTQDSSASAILPSAQFRRLQVGSNVLRLYQRPDAVIMLSATNDSGVVTWERQLSSNDLYAMAGQVFLRGASGVRWFAKIDALSGNTQPEVQFPLSASTLVPIASDRFALFSNSIGIGLTAARLEAFTVDAAPAWSGTVFRAHPLSTAFRNAADNLTCLKPTLSVSANGDLTVYTRFSVLPKPSEPQQGASFSAAYRLRFSSTGALLDEQNLGDARCPPAGYPDGSSLAYAANYGVRKIRPDSSVEWNRQLPTSGGHGRTYLLGDGTAIAQEGDATSRLSDTGALLGFASLKFSDGLIAQLADAVPKGATELLAVDFNGRVFRTDGAVLSWTVKLPRDGCGIESARTVRLLPHLEQSVLVLFNDCDGAKVARVSDTGSVLWQQMLDIDNVAPSTQASAAFADASGQVFVAGCTFDTSGVRARTLVQAFNADGTRKWTFAHDVAPGNNECPTAITTLSDGRTFVAITSDRDTHRAHLLQITAAGTFDGISTISLEGPANVANEMVSTPGDRLAVLGTAPLVLNATNAFMTQSLREIQPASFARPWRVEFAAATQTQYRYGDLMTLVLRLVNPGGTDLPTAQPVRIGVYGNQGEGRWVGDSECVVPIGSSQCTVQGRWSKVEPVFSLRAESDGVANAFTVPFSLLAATPTVTINPVTPLTTAWDLASFDVVVDAPAPVDNIIGAIFRVSLSGGFDPSCTGNLVFKTPPFTHRCTMRLPGGSRTFSVSIESTQTQYNSAQGQQSFGPIARAQPSIVVEPETTAPTRIGDRARLFVQLMVNGRDVTAIYGGGSLSINCQSAHCTPAALGDFNGVARYYIDAYMDAVGVLPVQVQFAGNLDLLPSVSTPINVEVVPGAGVRGELKLPEGYNPRFCATAPGVSCVTDVSGEFFCDLPVGWSGEIFPLVDGMPNISVTFRDAPIRLMNAQQVRHNVRLMPVYRDTSFGGCAFDVDGDSTVRPYTDGMVILRAILGLTGAPLVANAGHVCVPVTGTALDARVMAQLQQAANNPSGPIAMDIDGDGQVSATTDGLLLLRALLGFDGDALLAGAVGAGATRSTAFLIRSYVEGCGAGSAM